MRLTLYLSHRQEKVHKHCNRCPVPLLKPLRQSEAKLIIGPSCKLSLGKRTLCSPEAAQTQLQGTCSTALPAMRSVPSFAKGYLWL